MRFSDIPEAHYEEIRLCLFVLDVECPIYEEGITANSICDKLMSAATSKEVAAKLEFLKADAIKVTSISIVNGVDYAIKRAKASIDFCKSINQPFMRPWVVLISEYNSIRNQIERIAQIINKKRSIIDFLPLSYDKSDRSLCYIKELKGLYSVMTSVNKLKVEDFFKVLLTRLIEYDEDRCLILSDQAPVRIKDFETWLNNMDNEE